MMLEDEFEEELKKINPNLVTISDKMGKIKAIALLEDGCGLVPNKFKIFDAESGWTNESRTLLTFSERDKIQNLLLNAGYIYKDNDLFSTEKVNTVNKKSKGNSFLEYTNYLADVLQEKNLAYGDSFTQTMDTWGMEALGIRLSDKLNRIASLIRQGKFKENDESLEDTLLDLAGYAVLGLKYLKEHEDENQSDL